MTFGTINAQQSSRGIDGARRRTPTNWPHVRGDTITRMLEDFDLLAGKVAELARLVQSLRTENQQLRAQLASSAAELDSMRGAYDEAGRRLDLLMERLPRLEFRWSAMEHLTVTILERDYRLACTPEEKDSLLKCARMSTARCRRSARPARSWARIASP